MCAEPEEEKKSGVLTNQEERLSLIGPDFQHTTGFVPELFGSEGDSQLQSSTQTTAVIGIADDALATAENRIIGFNSSPSPFPVPSGMGTQGRQEDAIPMRRSRRRVPATTSTQLLNSSQNLVEATQEIGKFLLGKKRIEVEKNRLACVRNQLMEEQNMLLSAQLEEMRKQTMILQSLADMQKTKLTEVKKE